MKRRIILYLVAFAAFLGPFTQTIYTPMLPEIQSHFATSHFLINLSISIFAMILALMQVVYGPLTDTYGRRKVLLPGLVLFAIASVGCAWAGSIESLLLFRALQAFGIATGSVVATTVIGDLFDHQERGPAMGTFQMLVALGAVLGPVVGGFVGTLTGYYGVFWVLAAVGLIMFVTNAFALPETKPELAAGERFRLRDFAGILKHKAGSAVILLGFIQYFTFYDFLVFLPEILTESYALSPDEKGLAFVPLSLAMVIGTYLGGRVITKIPAHKFLILTSALNVGSILLFIWLAHVSLLLLIFSIFLFGLFFGLSVPVQTTLLTSAFLRERATAIGFYNFSRYMGMAAGPMIGATLYQVGGIPVLFGTTAMAFAVVVWLARRSLITQKRNPRLV